MDSHSTKAVREIHLFNYLTCTTQNNDCVEFSSIRSSTNQLSSCKKFDEFEVNKKKFRNYRMTNEMESGPVGNGG